MHVEANINSCFETRFSQRKSHITNPDWLNDCRQKQKQTLPKYYESASQSVYLLFVFNDTS